MLDPETERKNLARPLAPTLSALAKPRPSTSTRGPRRHKLAVPRTPSRRPRIAESTVPATEMPSVRTVASPTTRKNGGETSGGKSPRANPPTARRFAGSASAEG